MPKIINHEQRKLEILEAGLKVLNSKEKFNIGNVANICGIKRTTVYGYYKNKHELMSDIENNFESLNEVEQCKYTLRTKELEDELYIKIRELVGDFRCLGMSLQ